MKTKKVTKKAINLAIKSKNTTELFRLAYLSGIDTSKKNNVFEFAFQNCKYAKRFTRCYSIVYIDKPNYYVPHKPLFIADNVNFAKKQRINSPYCKILIKGNNNWYWASPVYKHSDYNKSIAFPINEFNNRLAYLLNKLILNNGSKM